MPTEHQTTDANVELAKQVGHTVLKGAIEGITGKSDSQVLSLLIGLCRIAGVVVFVCALFQLSHFGALAQTMRYASDSSPLVVWLKVSGIGLLIGLQVYCVGALIALLRRIELHLRILAGRT